MNLSDIHPAIEKIRSSPKLTDARAITYLATYPSILKFGKALGTITANHFNQLVVMAYGWMPRIVRINQRHVPKAIAALTTAASAKVIEDLSVGQLRDIECCVNSVVGASKVLHFVNDDVFPIWDSNVESFRLKRPASTYHMRSATNYFCYADEVRGISRDPTFGVFFSDFTVCLQARLAALHISGYAISQVRAIEAAAFELA